MADILCGYTADRDETLIGYLYGEIAPAQRSAFEAHVATCERCRHDLSELRGVRRHLQAWTAPDATGSVLPAVREANPPDAAVSPHRRGVRATLREIPVWAQVAAALLLLGVSAGLANFDVRYDQGGLTIRTGWFRTPPGAVAQVGSRAEERTHVAGASVVTPWRADLDALEGRLTRELHGSAARTVVARVPPREASPGAADEDVVHRMRTLVRESERKQQNDLALRIAEVVREFDSKRGNDLVNINQTLRTMQSSTGIEVLKQREALSRLDYLVRASGQR